MTADELIEAMEKSGLSEKEACFQMDVRPSQWANQKAGTNRNHVSLQRVGGLEPETLREFAVLILVALGVPRWVRAGALVYLGLRGHRRMAKAQLVLADSQKAVI